MISKLAFFIGTTLAVNSCDDDLLGKIELNPVQVAGYMFDDRSGTGSWTTLYSGKNKDIEYGWNDVVSSVRITYGFACSFYYNGELSGCLGTLPKESKQVKPSYYSKWDGDWENRLSSYKCGRLCTKKQDNCKTYDYSRCSTLEQVYCLICEEGYYSDVDGHCVVSPNCAEIRVEITSVGEVIPNPVPEYVSVDTVSINNCDHSQDTGGSQSTGTKTSVTHKSSYSRSESWSDTFSVGIAQEVAVSYDTGVKIAGVGASTQFSASFSSDQSWENTESGDETWVETDSVQEVSTWESSFSFVAETNHVVNYTIMGSRTEGSVPYQAIATCINSGGVDAETQSFSGTYTSAVITETYVTVADAECGADDAFDQHVSTYCSEYHGSPVYSSLLEAQQDCYNLPADLEITACAGVYDKFCNGELGYFLCAEEAELKYSEGGSCVWTPKKGDDATPVRRRSEANSSGLPYYGDAHAKVLAGELLADQATEVDANGNPMQNQHGNRRRVNRLIRSSNPATHLVAPTRK